MFQCASCNRLLKELQLILRMLELYIFSQVVSREFRTLCFSRETHVVRENESFSWPRGL